MTEPAEANMLGQIRAVTTTAPDLDAIEDAYARFLGYRTVERGVVGASTAMGWNAPATAGSRILVMMPESGAETYLRFVEQPLPAAYRPLTSFGWNATEILVQDVNALAARLEKSPFQVIGPPRELTGLPGIAAMQVVGPAREVLYLTHKAPIPGVDVPLAKSFVDYCFIAVLGGPDLDAMIAFYRDRFGNAPGPVLDVPITVLSLANNLPPETKRRLVTTPLRGPDKIEMDQYPAGAGPRITPKGGLPPGMAMVTFDYGRMDDLPARPVAPVSLSRHLPFREHRTVTIRGVAGELIELVES